MASRSSVKPDCLPGALIRNRDLHFICEHIYVRVETSDSPFTNELTSGTVLRIPIAHAEGNYICDDDTLAELQHEDRIVFRYCEPDGTHHGRRKSERIA